MSSTPHAPQPSRHTEEAQAGAPPVRWMVVILSGAVILAIALWALISPSQAQAQLSAVVAVIAANAGWYYVLTAGLIVLFVLILAFGRSGRLVLGEEGSRPQFSLFTWSAMLFAGGIGIDLMFFSVAEPVSHFLVPPQGEVADPLNPATDPVARARMGVVWTLFHYGITGWAMYALMGAAFAYAAHRRGQPLSLRSVLAGAVGDVAHRWLGTIVDVISVLGTIFGIAASLGIGVVQLNYGLHLLLGVPEGIAAQIALILLAVVMATISTVSGVERGIRRLSELNIVLATILLAWVTLTGRTRFVLDALVTSVGDYATALPGLMLEVFPYTDADSWMQSWTLFFWAWWIAWAPFVGLFLARISRGRTIRQFVLGVLLVPFAFIAVFIAVFGNSALLRVLDGDLTFAQTAVSTPEHAFYSLLAQYPGAPMVIAVATLLGLLFYVTSADSGALVLSTFCSRTRDAMTDGGRALRVFWAFATGLLTFAMLMVGGVAALQGATVIIGLPLSVVMYLVMWALYRAVREDLPDREDPSVVSVRDGVHAAARDDSGTA